MPMGEMITIIKRRIHKLLPLGHLLLALVLHCSAIFIVVPTMADVTMTAICPGADKCSQAIYLSGLQQAIAGIGTMVMTPILGKFSDDYGRKPLLLLAFTASVIPSAVLSYSREKAFIYVYYVLRTLVAVVTEGSVQCLSFAYVADNVEDHLRGSTFGILAGVLSFGFVISTLAARLLTESYVFKVSTLLSVLSALYLKLFVEETNDKLSSLHGTRDEPLCPPISDQNVKPALLGSQSFLHDIVEAVKTNPILLQVTVIVFFSTLGEAGLHGSLWYYLKATFHFGKDEFSELLLIAGVTGAISQLILIPILMPILGEKKVLCIGLFASFCNAVLYGLAWARWVPYLSASTGMFSVFVSPSIVSIVSNNAGPEEQGKMQGLVAGIRSFATIISPLAISPLTALFLSDNPPFHCQGFSFICAAFSLVVALVQGCIMRQPSIPMCHYKGSNYVQVHITRKKQTSKETLLLV